MALALSPDPARQLPARAILPFMTPRMRRNSQSRCAPEATCKLTLRVQSATLGLPERRYHGPGTRIAAARGESPAELVLRGAQTLCMVTGARLPGDVAIHDGQIVGVGARL